MGSLAALNRLGRSFGLCYRFLLTLAAGALLAGLAAAGLRAGAVRTELARAEQVFNQGRLAEADRLLAGLEPWARCFPGRYRECAALRVRSLARLGHVAQAMPIAEAMRSASDSPVPRPEWTRLTRDPLSWLHQTTLSLVSRLMGSVFPPTLTNPWAGYEALIGELSAVEDRNALNRLADQLRVRFPNSLIALKAAGARAELTPPPAPSPPPSANGNPPSSRKPDQAPEPQAAPPPAPEAAPPFPAAWGIVTNTRAVAHHSRTGQPVRELQPGDVLAIEGSGLIRNEPALTGALILSNRAIPDLAFRPEDLEIRSGSFNSIPPQEVALRSRLAEIEAEENNLRLRLAREHAALTPEEKAYRDAQARLDAFAADAEKLKAEADRKTGAERMRILDRLRAMKYQEQTLLRAVTERKQALEKTGGHARSRELAREQTALLLEKQAILKRLNATPP